MGLSPSGCSSSSDMIGPCSGGARRSSTGFSGVLPEWWHLWPRAKSLLLLSDNGAKKRQAVTAVLAFLGSCRLSRCLHHSLAPCGCDRLLRKCVATQLTLSSTLLLPSPPSLPRLFAQLLCPDLFAQTSAQAPAQVLVNRGDPWLLGSPGYSCAETLDCAHLGSLLGLLGPPWQLVVDAIVGRPSPMRIRF
ncbi:hypothetical protein GGR58DRAFT_526312 [Xylaria digitata]|nr:hypothetical protein GGR58DRAFT_526312 [Xylaria digitata]